MVQRILVPLDGTRSSASVVPYAAEMASRMPFKVNLLLVLPESGARLPHPDHHQQNGQDQASGKSSKNTPSDDDLTRANERYLARHAQEFHQLGVETEEHLRWGVPVDEILHAALDLRCDFIAMATRHRGQHSRSDKRSVAEEVVWRSRLPVLVVAEG